MVKPGYREHLYVCAYYNTQHDSLRLQALYNTDTTRQIFGFYHLPWPSRHHITARTHSTNTT